MKKTKSELLDGVKDLAESIGDVAFEKEIVAILEELDNAPQMIEEKNKRKENIDIEIVDITEEGLVFETTVNIGNLFKFESMPKETLGVIWKKLKAVFEAHGEIVT